MTEVVRARVETPTSRARRDNAALASTSRTSRSSTRSGTGASRAPSGNGKRGMTSPQAASTSRHRPRTSCGARGRSRSEAVCSANAGTAAASSRPSSAARRSRAMTSNDHMSTCAWSAAITTVASSAPSTTHKRCEGPECGVQWMSRMPRTASLSLAPGAVSCSTQRPSPKVTSRNRGPASPDSKRLCRVPCRWTTRRHAAARASRSSTSQRSVMAIQDPGRSPAPTCRAWSKETGSSSPVAAMSRS